MALGQAAGTAACIAIEDNVPPRQVDIFKLQRRLLQQGAVLIYFQDVKPGDDHFEALQFFALRGFFGTDQWEANLKQLVTSNTAKQWITWTRVEKPKTYTPGKTTRGELLDMLYQKVLRLPAEKIVSVKAVRY